jgi:hypothetical protein
MRAVPTRSRLLGLDSAFYCWITFLDYIIHSTINKDWAHSPPLLLLLTQWLKLDVQELY